MDKERVELFDLNGVQIKTTVIDIKKEEMMVVKHILALLHSASENQTKVIGFDVQFVVENNITRNQECSGRQDTRCESRCAVINFCIGYSCLIIRLTSLSSSQRFSNSFQAVLNLLSLPDYTFVGVGIKHNLAKLEQEHGIGCVNAVELGSLAASLMNKPRLSFCGVDELAFAVNNLDLRKHRPISIGYSWRINPLSTELIKLATVNVYSYYKIGSTLLGWDASIPPEPCFDE